MHSNVLSKYEPYVGMFLLVQYIKSLERGFGWERTSQPLHSLLRSVPETIMAGSLNDAVGVCCRALLPLTQSLSRS